MRLFVRRVRVVSITADRQYAADISFGPGLNILRAANSSGKTTIVNSILFALGMEGMLGPGQQRPLKSCMYQVIADADGEHPVLESYVMVELENDRGEKLTTRRNAHGGHVSPNLVRVWDGWALTDAAGQPRDTYANVEGSATRESGFHRQLEAFIGWDLPEVTRYDGRPVKLYMQLLFPFLFVEQKLWLVIRAGKRPAVLPGSRSRPPRV